MIGARASVRTGKAAPFMVLLAAWALFAILWMGLHAAYPLHIPLVPLPGLGSLSQNAAAFLFAAPPALAMAIVILARLGTPYARVAWVAASCLSILLFLAAALIGLALAG